MRFLQACRYQSYDTALPRNKSEWYILGNNSTDILKGVFNMINRKITKDPRYSKEMEPALLSESALAKEWLSPEEVEAWKDL